MNADTVTAVISTAATVVGLLVAYAAYRHTTHDKDAEVQMDVTFLRIRRELKSASTRSHLESVAKEAQREYLLAADVPLLVRPGWIVPRPLPLDAVRMDWVEPAVAESQLSAAFEPARRVIRRYWTGSSQYRDTYHDVIERLEETDPKLFFNGSSFRLLDVSAGTDGVSQEKFPVTLTFTAGWYFDALDTTDVLGYETAALSLSPRRRDAARMMRGRYRTWLGSPFNLQKRCGIPGVNTLTIRRGTPVPTFILHERSLQKVATSKGVTHVVPAGEFQPRDLSSLASVVDLDLWNNITREYAEEFLGLDDAQGQSIDTQYSSRLDEVASALNDARGDGGVSVWFLGVGMDPLMWKPEILTVAIFEPEVFDTIFRDMVTENDEGRLIFRDAETKQMTPFTESNTNDRIRDRLLPAGAGCLALAWQHRSELGIRD
jgi:hypothetical protein